MSAWLAIGAGLGVGALHALLVARAARGNSGMAFVRLLLSSAVITWSVHVAQLWICLLGFGIGFGAMAVRSYRRLL